MSSLHAIRRRARIGAVIVAMVVIAVTAITYGPPSVNIRNIGSGFDCERAMERLREFVGDSTPRAVATPGHDAALERLRARLSSMNCTVSEQNFFARGWNRKAVAMTNLLVRVAGSERSADLPMVLLSAHYDGVPMGPGAGDNAVGVACAIEIVEELAADRPKRDVLVLFTDGEETGLCGALAFAQDAPEWASVGAVVNLDARGSDGPVHIFEVGADGPKHAQLLAKLNLPAHTTSLAGEAYKRMPNGTDFTVYQRGGKAGFNLAFIGSPRNYHTPADTLEHVDPATLCAMGTSALELVRALSSGAAPMPSARSGSTPDAKSIEETPAVWFDVLGLFVAHWPSWVSIVAAIASMCALCWAIARLRRRDQASLIGAVLAIVETLIGLMVATIVGSLASAGVRASGLCDFPWPQASVWWGESALLVLGAMTSLALSRMVARRRLRRRSGECVSWDAFIGGWIALSMLGLLAALAAPGAAHPLVVPLAFAAGAGAIAVSRQSPVPDLCALVAFAAAFIVLAPLECAFADAFGLSMGGFTAARGAILMISLRPLALPQLAQCTE